MVEGLEWDDLRTFLMIARHGTLSAAARALRVQQPTMTRRLAALERRAGARLLQKTPSGYVLTPAGEAVLGNVERIEAEVFAVERRIAGRDVRLEGTVRLTTVETLAAEVLPPILAAFHQEYPGIRVELFATPRSLSLTQREADVALRLVSFTQADVAVRKLAEIEFAVYAAPAYLERHGRPDFAAGAEGHCLVRTESGLLTPTETEWLRAHAGKAVPVLFTNSRYAQRAAAVAGMGLAVLTRYLGDDVPGLVRLGAPRMPLRELWMGVHADIRHTPRIRAFTDALQLGFRRAAARLHPSGV